MQRQRFTLHGYPLPLSRHSEFSRSHQESSRARQVPDDLGPTGQEVAYEEEPDDQERKQTYEPSARLLPAFRSVFFVLGSAVLGIVLAFVWRYTDVQQWSTAQWWPAFAAQSTKSESKQGPEEQLMRIIGELEALKKITSDLGAAQQQTGSIIASLQASQQDLQKRASSAQAGPHWYSDPALLMLKPRASAPTKSITGAPPQPSAPRARAETR
jgi:hypothetical protein